jgi:hypothetical protein
MRKHDLTGFEVITCENLVLLGVMAQLSSSAVVSYDLAPQQHWSLNSESFGRRSSIEITSLLNPISN